jgi:glycosyltransferase involved in cell wall biosynthesis
VAPPLHADDGLRVYLDAKSREAGATGAFEHHVVRAGEVRRALRHLRPEVVILHDSVRGAPGLVATAHAYGASVVAVHRGLRPAPLAALSEPGVALASLLTAYRGRRSSGVDAVMIGGTFATDRHAGGPARIPLRLGVREAFRPRSERRRGDATVYVGPLTRRDGVFALLEAAAAAPGGWPLRLIGSGPAEDRIAERAERLGIAHRVQLRAPVDDARLLARVYAGARCIVAPARDDAFAATALEAAATGAPVVAPVTAPAARVLGDLAHVYLPGEPEDLGAAITGARAAKPDYAAASALAHDQSWPRVIADELAALRRVVIAART